MQKEHVGDAPFSDVGTQVQALMEEYLRAKEAIEPPSTAAGDDRLAFTPDSAPVAQLKQRVVERMAPLIESIARRYAGAREVGGSEVVDDLIGEGYVGLLTAIDQYRMDRGARFSTYATHRVHGQIRHYLRDRGNRRLIRAPSWLQELTARLNKEEAKLLVELGRPATTAELAERLNLQEDAVEELVAKGVGPAVLSLTERGGDDEEGGGVDLCKIRNHHYVSWQLPVEDQIFIEGMMVRLKETERRVITLFFYQDLSQSEIARSLNISCNYVGYLLKNGLRKLRKQIEADELRDAQLRVVYAPRRMAGDPSVIDPATGLYNATYFHGRLGEEIARACRYRRDLSLVVFRFSEPPAPEAGPVKGGRSAPDTDAWGLAPAVSKELGVALRECLRKADIPARLDEQTLAIALPQTGVGARVAAKRMTELLSGVTTGAIAGGIAHYPIDGRDPDTLLHAAIDRALDPDATPESASSVPLGGPLLAGAVEVFA